MTKKKPLKLLMDSSLAPLNRRPDKPHEKKVMHASAKKRQTMIIDVVEEQANAMGRDYQRRSTAKQSGTRIEQFIEHDHRAVRRLQTHNWLLGEPEILKFFEVRHRGVELWKIARLHFQSKSNKTPQEAFGEQLLHNGSITSKFRRNQWTIHPESLLKFVIYFIKLLTLLYNFFYIPAM